MAIRLVAEGGRGSVDRHLAVALLALESVAVGAEPYRLFLIDLRPVDWSCTLAVRVMTVGWIEMKFVRWAVWAFLGAAWVPLRAQFPRSVTEPAAVAAGSQIYAKDCAKCHGDDARGTPDAPDLIRSTMVLHDRRENLRGKELAPYLRTMGSHQFEYDEKQANELSQFLSAQVNKILRSGYDDRPKDLLSGDAKAGEAFFNGQGGCSKCHSVTGDLAGVGRKYSAAALQQRYLFPQAVLGKKAPVTATLKLAGGEVVTGDIVRIDDFTVTLRDGTGEIRSFNRGPGVRVTTKDPYAGHIELLDTITDTDIHNLTTYLDTLQ